jgi:hypothetical protein
MAPERFSGIGINGSSKESDVYSLVMTSFKVCFSAANCPTIWCNHPVMIRSSQEYCHMVTVIIDKMADDITRGKRPSRPTDPSQNKWLQDPVWDAITTCWSDLPEQRYELSIVYHVFSSMVSRRWECHTGSI